MKRIICVILTLMLLASAGISAGADFGADDTALMLYSLGIVGEDYSARLSEPVTRCELAKISVEMMGFDESQIKAMGSEMTSFSDVHPLSLAGMYVGAANKLGLMNGYGEAFGVNDHVRYEDALRVLLRTVGYGDYAEKVVGIYRAASDTGITDGVYAGDAEAITFATLFELISNTLEVDMMYAVDKGGQTDYVRENGKTLLGSIHNMTLVEGIVTADEHTDIFGDSPADSGYIRIDSKQYAYSDSLPQNLIGSHVDAYVYDADSARPSVKYIRENENGKSVFFDVDAFEKADSDRIHYYIGNKSYDEKISDTADVVYNGKWLCKYYDLDKSVLESIVYGNITLRENDGDSYFDLIAVNSIITNMITGYDPSSSLLICEEMSYDLSGSQRDSVIVQKDGTLATETSLMSGMAVEITESADKKVITLNVLTKSVIGAPSQIDDESVMLNSAMYEYISKYTPADFKFGKVIKVFLNSSGKIVYASPDGVTDEFVYGLVAGIKSGKGLDSTCTLKIFDTAGKMNEYEVSQKYKLDSAAYNTSDKLGETFGSLNTAQVIRFRLGEDGKINAIDSINTGADEDETNLTENCSNANLMYKTTKTFGNGEYYLADNTVIFSAPDDINDDNRYYIYSPSNFKNDTSYTVSVYDADEYYVPGIIVVTNSSGMIAEDNSIIVVEDVKSAFNSEGDAVSFIYGGADGSAGKTKYWYAENNSDFSSIKCGDIIQVSAYATGEISDFKVLLSADSPLGCTSNSSRYNYSYGTIERFDKVNGICVINTVEAGESRERISVIGSVNGYRFSETRDGFEVIMASNSDLISGRKIYVRERYLQPVEFVVFD